MQKLKDILNYLKNIFSFGPSKEEIEKREEEERLLSIEREKEEAQRKAELEEFRLKKLEEYRIQEEKKALEEIEKKKKQKELEEELAAEKKRLLKIKEEEERISLEKRRERMRIEVERQRQDKLEIEEKRKAIRLEEKRLTEKRLKEKAEKLVLKKEEIAKAKELEAKEKIKKQEEELLEADKKRRENKDIKILIAEDSSINQKIMKSILDRMKIKCSIASDGQEVIDMFKNGSFSLILMDIEMPILDGIEATKNILSYIKENNLKDIPIIALTANDQDTHIKEYIEAGMKECLSKPINADKLKEIIENYS